MKRWIFSISVFLCFLFYSCKTLKSAATLSSANVGPLNGPAKISFAQDISLIILNVKIKGHPYRFIFDTGAGATLVSKEISDALGLKTVGEIQVEAGNNVTKAVSVSVIDTLHLDGFYYTNVGVLVNDIKQIPEMACIHVDGVLGINAIKLINWQINYDSSVITAYSKNTALNLLPQFTAQTFKPNSQGMPSVNFLVNNVTENFVIDIGKSADVVGLSKKSKLPATYPKTIQLGYSSTGIFGSKIDTTTFAKCSTFSNNTVSFTNVIISQTSNSKSLIGNGFLKKNFSAVAIDFANNIFYTAAKPNNNLPYLWYGIKTKVVNNQVVIGAKALNFSADVDKLNVNDTILQINNLQFNGSNACLAVDEIEKSKNKQAPLTLKIIKANTTYTYTLAPKSIVP